VAVCLVAVAALGVQSYRLTRRERQLAALELAPRARAAAEAKARVETVTVQLAATVRTVTKLLRDTIVVPARVLHPTTAADTAAAVVALPVVTQRLDSTRAACSLLVTDCDRYRIAAEQRAVADSNVRAGLEAQVRALERSGLAAAWDRVKVPLAYGAGVASGLAACRK
jgi:hypothetical protein